MSREWRDVVGFDGYQVSDDGKVKSYVNNRYGIKEESEHILKPMPNRYGYDTVCLGRGNRKLVHRLVADAFIPNPDGLPLVRHLDDNPRNNHVTNLAWGTQTDNMQDCVRHGRLVGDTRSAIESKKNAVVAMPIAGGENMIFSSINEAARSLGLWPQHISSNVRGKLKQTGGYTFVYAKDGDCG